MSKPLSILDQGDFQFYSVSRTGITFKDETTREVWLDAMQQLCGMHEGAKLTEERTLMMIADALNYGESHFSEEFAQAIDGARMALGLKPKTIANAKWAYGKIEASRRRETITLGHYMVVAALEPAEQDKYFDQIETHRMTIWDLKEIVAEEHPKTKRGAKRKTSEETEATALQKLEDVLEWIKGNGISQKFKPGLEAAYLLYRRKFINKKGKRR